MTLGPVQVLVLGFDDAEFRGEILAEIDRLGQSDVVRLVDLLAVRKHDDGTLERLHRSDLSAEEAEEFGAVVGALVGFGAAGPDGAEIGAAAGAEAMADGGHVLDDDKLWYVEDSIPRGSAAAIALFEHRWAIPLRESIRRANGTLLADAWIHASDLVEFGLLAREEAATH